MQKDNYWWKQIAYSDISYMNCTQASSCIKPNGGTKMSGVINLIFLTLHNIILPHNQIICKVTFKTEKKGIFRSPHENKDLFRFKLR